MSRGFQWLLVTILLGVGRAFRLPTRNAATLWIHTGNSRRSRQHHLPPASALDHAPALNSWRSRL